MARPREFEPNEALHNTMLLFWQKGYLDTSMAEIVQVTGVSRYGLYHTFGDKNELFVRAIDHYAQTVINSLMQPLETATAGVAEIRSYFHYLLTMSQTEVEQAGCLIGNTAMEIPAVDQAVAARIETHYARMHHAFLNALTNAVQNNEVSLTDDLEAYADYLVGIANGFLACLRTKMSPQSLQRYFEVALRDLM